MMRNFEKLRNRNMPLVPRALGFDYLTSILLLFLFVLFGFGNTAFAQFAGGTGTEKNPYQISSHEHLDNVREHLNDTDVHFILINNIDLTNEFNEGGAYYNEGEGWIPIGDSYGNSFKGSFNGNGFTVKGLYINREERNQGLFGYIRQSQITDLGVTDINIVNSDTPAGGLVGTNSGGIIDNCFTTGTITGAGGIGGLAGSNSGIIKNSYSECDVTATHSAVGGLVGGNRPGSEIINSYSTGIVNGVGQFSTAGGLAASNSGIIKHSYSTGEVSGSGLSTGGLVGSLSHVGAEVKNSYSTGNVSGEGSYVGGLIGYSYEPVIIKNSYSTGNVQGGTSAAGGLVGRFTRDATVINSYYDLSSVKINGEHLVTIGALHHDIYNDWINNGLSLDVNEYLSSSGDRYLIRDVSDFKKILAFGQFSDLNFLLANDIDLSNEPGLYIPYFVGHFNGNNKEISNLNVNLEKVPQIGLFALAVEALIENVKLVDATVVNESSANVGGLVGDSYKSTIINSLVSGNITGGENIGGLVGFSRNTDIDNCSSYGSVKGVGRIMYIGGLVGWNQAGSHIKNSYSTSTVEATRGGAGGFAGCNQSNAIIEQSYSTGDVTGDRAGGFIGVNAQGSSVVRNCYSTGNVVGTDRVGGFAGSGGLQGSYMESCYSTGNVTGNSNAGGFIGTNPATHSITNSYSRGSVTRKEGSDSENFGGFCGSNSNGVIVNSFSTGSVSYEESSNPVNKGFCGDVSTGGAYEMTGNYWDTETSKQSSTSGDAEGKTTEEMTYPYDATYLDWDFNEIWKADTSLAINDGYPFLRMEPIVTTGSLNITILPQEAIDAGAQWRRTETTRWQNSGAPESGISPGTYDVEFKELNDWEQPNNIEVEIVVGETTQNSGRYIRHTGSLTITITPEGAVEAGMQWRRQGTEQWYDSGVTEDNIPTGEYVIEFKPVDGYLNPATARVNVGQGPNTFNWEYTEAAKVLPGVMMLLLDE